MLQVKCITGVAELATLSEQWDQLLAQSTNNSYSLSWAWLNHWMNNYLSGNELLTLAVYDEEKLVGLAPLWVERKRQFGLARLKMLQFIGSEEVCGDHVDLIVSRKNSEAICTAIWEHLSGPARKAWDVWEYNGVCSHSGILQCLRKISDEDRRCLGMVIHEYSICPYIDLPASWEIYLTSLSANQRRAFKVSSDAMSQTGKVELRLCDSAGDLPAFMNTHIELHRKSWNDRGQHGSFATEKFRKFHREYALELLGNGKLVLCNLELDGTPVGSFYGFEHNKVLHYYLLGVDRSAVPKASIGRVLIGKCIETAIQRGCTRFDFLRGFETYKYDWTDLEKRELSVTFYNRTASALLYILRQFLSRYSRQVGNVLLGERFLTVKKLLGRGPKNGMNA